MNEIKSQSITMCHGLARICRHTEVCRPNALARNAGPIIEKRENRKKAYPVLSSSWCNIKSTSEVYLQWRVSALK